MLDALINRLLKKLLNLFVANPSIILDLLFDIFQRLPVLKSLPGMYEVLEYEACLELKDPGGQVAIYSKQQKVRFLQNNVIAYQDRAWGDGDIFADYKCAPGVEVDRYREGNRYNILISLRETKHRGDEMTFYIERTIHHGFTATVEEFQTDIDHRTHRLALSIVFPEGKVPLKVSLIEQHAARTSPLHGEYLHVLPDGRQKYRWTTKSARLYESYILHWEW